MARPEIGTPKWVSAVRQQNVSVEKVYHIISAASRAVCLDPLERYGTSIHALT
jgi:hypothetical protein